MIKIVSFFNLTTKKYPLCIILLILLVSLAYRSIFINFEFPLNDGGLFFQMTTDLIAHHFQIPISTTYNHLSLPFTYPPLGFYLAGTLAVVFHTSLVSSLITLPTIFTSLIPLLIYILCRKLGYSTKTALIATLLYIVFPRSYTWLLMGGGITRATGLCLGLISLIFALSTSHKKNLLLSGLFLGLTFLSHLEMGIFVLVSLVTFGLLKKTSFAYVFRITCLSLIILTPWLITVILQSGLHPFIAAFGSGEWSALVFIYNITTFSFAGEAFPAITPVLSIISLLLLIKQKKYLLPLWLFIVLAANQRSGGTVATPLLALVCSLGVQKISKYVPVIILLVLVLKLPFSVLTAPYPHQPELESLDTTTQVAFKWIKQNTDPTSKFLILPSRKIDQYWMLNKTTEWFPALTDRQSIITAQGTEWLSPQLFETQRDLNMILYECLTANIDCIENQTYPLGNFDHIYVRTIPASHLQESLSKSKKYQRIYDENQIQIYKLKKS